MAEVVNLCWRWGFYSVKAFFQNRKPILTTSSFTDLLMYVYIHIYIHTHTHTYTHTHIYIHTYTHTHTHTHINYILIHKLISLGHSVL